MKLRNQLIPALSLFISAVCAQGPVTKITIKDEVYYITTDIGYPITGTYLYESKGEPTVELNAGGKGRFQLHGMSKTPMNWGIECDEKGVPKKVEGPGGARYLLWYQITEKNVGTTYTGSTWESGEIGKWDAVNLSVSFSEKKIYIMGERIKGY